MIKRYRLRDTSFRSARGRLGQRVDMELEGELVSM